MSKLETWERTNLLIEAGNTKDYETGNWRTWRPILDIGKCANCLICWIYCPDAAVIVEGGEVRGFNLFHCKGCGICAKECPPKIQAIKMVLESETDSSSDAGLRVKEEENND